MKGFPNGNAYKTALRGAAEGSSLTEVAPQGRGFRKEYQSEGGAGQGLGENQRHRAFLCVFERFQTHI